MPRLFVQDFSCIKFASIDLAPLTVVIGPQASGKSLLSKLFYFFADIMHSQYGAAERGLSIKPHLKELGKRFSTTFPSNAWGDGVFTIRYDAGPIGFEIIRKRTANRLSKEVSVKASSFYESQYSSYFSSTQRLKRRSRVEDDLAARSYSPEMWDIRRSAMSGLISILGNEYIEAQLLVPAGRSFYTNLGKAVAMFEFGSQLEPPRVCRRPLVVSYAAISMMSAAA
jgi:hypothetical protein